MLNVELFTSLLEAEIIIEEHRVFYNEERIHSSLGYLPPAKFARLCVEKERKTAAKKGPKSAVIRVA